MLESLVSWVMLTSFYGAIVGVILLFVKGILRHKISPQWHYALWSILLIKLLFPYGPESTLSIFNLFTQEKGIVEQLGEGAVEKEELIKDREQTTALSVMAPETPTFSEEKINTATGSVNQLEDNWEVNGQAIILYIWLIGVMGVGGTFLISYLQFQRGLHRIPRNQTPYIETLMMACKGELQIKQDIPVIVQDTLSSPALVGVVYPKILLSKEVLTLDEEELKYILLHELAHYKRKDTWVNVFILSFQVIHWFNPILFYCLKCIRQDIELCADDLVIKKLDLKAQKEYGRTLLKVLELIKGEPSLRGALTMASDKKGFQYRIRHIASKEWFVKYRKQVMVSGVLCLLVLSTLLLTSGKQEKLEDVIHLDPKGESNVHDIGIEYARLKGYKPLGENIELPFGDYRLRIQDIYGDTTRIAFHIEVEGIDRAIDQDGLYLELEDKEKKISVVTRSGSDNTSLDVELRTEGHSWGEHETLPITVRLKKQDTILEETRIALPLSKDRLLEGNDYKGGEVSYVTDGFFTLEGVRIDPTMMEVQMSSDIKGRKVKGLYQPILTGDEQGLYNQTPSISGSIGDKAFSQYIIPSAYFDGNSQLLLQAEGYTYTLEEPEPITLHLKDTYPKSYTQGDQTLMIENVYYENGMLHIKFGQEQPIDYLGGIKIEGETKNVGATVRGDEENPETIYMIHTSYKESYDVTLDIHWIAQEKISMSIKLK